MIEEGTNDLTPASLCLPEKFRGPSRVDAFEMGWSYPARETRIYLLSGFCSYTGI